MQYEGGVMKRLSVILFALLFAACGVPGTTEQPTAAPVVITQVIVVSATPIPATATPKASPTPKPSATPKPTAVPTEQPTPTPNLLGKWTVTEDASSFDDSKTILLRLEAENQITGPSGDYLPTLLLRCNEKETEAYVHTGMAPDVESGNLDGATVRYRFDKEPAQTENAGQSTDGNALFFEDSQTVITTMLKHEKLVFGFTPYGVPPVEMTFDLRGLSEAIKPLNEACK
jgi:type VI secretion system protein VasI